MEVVQEYVGPEAAKLYGVCQCPTSTIQNQRWILARPSFPPPRSDGSVDLSVTILCGLCGAPFGSWL